MLLNPIKVITCFVRGHNYRDSIVEASVGSRNKPINLHIYACNRCGKFKIEISSKGSVSWGDKQMASVKLSVVEEGRSLKKLVRKLYGKKL